MLRVVAVSQYACPSRTLARSFQRAFGLGTDVLHGYRICLSNSPFTFPPPQPSPRWGEGVINGRGTPRPCGDICQSCQIHVEGQPSAIALPGAGVFQCSAAYQGRHTAILQYCNYAQHRLRAAQTRPAHTPFTLHNSHFTLQSLPLHPFTLHLS